MRTCTRCLEAKPFEFFSKKLKGLQSQCKECVKLTNAEYREKNREVLLEKGRQHYAANREALLERQKAYYAMNREDRLAYIRKWREVNPGYSPQWYAENAERERQRSKQWKVDNPDRKRIMEVAKRSAKRRIPKWADRSLMADVYRYAKIVRTAGVNCHVDHIVPLRGKTVCGFHSHENLTVLLAEDNLKKGAKLV